MCHSNWYFRVSRCQVHLVQIASDKGKELYLTNNNLHTFRFRQTALRAILVSLLVALDGISEQYWSNQRKYSPHKPGINSILF